MNKAEFEFDLGERVKDTMTNFQGVIIVRNQHITGCDRYCVLPEETDDGDYPSSTWFDEQRLVRCDEDGERIEDESSETTIVQELKEKISDLSAANTGPSGSSDPGKPTGA